MSFDFLKVVDLQSMQELLDSFHHMTGLHASVLDGANSVLCTSGLPRVCEAFHQRFPEQSRRCFPQKGLGGVVEKPAVAKGCAGFQCHLGLIAAASPMMVEGRQVATILVGPFLNEPADLAIFGPRAESSGFQRETFLEFLAEVPVVSLTRVTELLGFFSRLVKMFTDLALQSIQHTEARSAAARSENKFRELFTHAADGIVIIDRGGCALEANPAMCDLLGYACEEFQQSGFSDFLSARYSERGPGRMQELLAQKAVLFETSLKHRQGYEVPVEIRAKAIVFDDKRAILCQVRDLRDRQEAERALRDSEERFRGIFEDAGIGMVLAAQDGHFLQVNPEFCRFLGYPRGELLTKTIDEVTHPEDRHLSKPFLAEGPDTGCSVITTEKRYLHKNGCPVWGRVTTVLRRSEPDRSLVSVAMIQDITVQKHAQQAIEQSQATLKSILTAAPMSIGLVQKRIFSWVNRWMLDEMGFAEDELIGKSARLLYETDAEFERVGMVKYAELAKGRMGEVQTRMRCKDGRMIDVLLRSVPLNSANLDEGVIFTASNITGLIRAETELKNALNEAETARQQVHTILSSVTAGLVVVDQAGLISMVNPAAERLLGIAAYERVGQPVADLLAETEFLAKIKFALAGDDQPDPVQLMLDQEGQAEKLCLQVKVASLREPNNGVRGAVAIMRDVTREHAINQMKDEFISTAAHELRTPMTSILGYTELMLERLEQFDAGQLKEFLQIIYDRSAALSQIISDMLDLSRVQSGRLINLEKFAGDLSALLQQIVPAYEYNDNGCKLIVEIDDPLPLTLFDPHKMIQVFDNLISNSVKFSPEGGAVTIKLQNHCDAILVTIKDRGIGMTSEQKAKVFEKFYRADYSSTAVSGLGLGMSLVKGIVEGHDGRIWVESAVGVGTTVYFTLPSVVLNESGPLCRQS